MCIHVCSLRGFYHNQAANLRAEQEVPSQKLITEVKEEVMVASTEYLKAADYYPVDDEKHACESPISDTCVRSTSIYPRLNQNEFFVRVPPHGVRRAFTNGRALGPPAHDLEQAARLAPAREADLGGYYSPEGGRLRKLCGRYEAQGAAVALG